MGISKIIERDGATSWWTVHSFSFGESHWTVHFQKCNWEKKGCKWRSDGKLELGIIQGQNFMTKIETPKSRISTRNPNLQEWKRRRGTYSRGPAIPHAAFWPDLVANCQNIHAPLDNTSQRLGRCRWRCRLRSCNSLKQGYESVFTLVKIFFENFEIQTRTPNLSISTNTFSERDGSPSTWAPTTLIMVYFESPKGQIKNFRKINSSNQLSQWVVWLAWENLGPVIHSSRKARIGFDEPSVLRPWLEPTTNRTFGASSPKAVFFATKRSKSTWSGKIEPPNSSKVLKWSSSSKAGNLTDCHFFRF